MAVQIQLRRDDSATWSALNPVLIAAEFGVETDTGKFKIGDGATPWGLLAYAASTPSELSSAVSSAITNLIDAAPGTLDTLNELASAINDDPDFFSTITSQIALKANATDLSDHLSDTLGVHGIADTSALETQTGAQSKADAARDAAKSYADALTTDDIAEGSTHSYFTQERAIFATATSYDVVGSAALAQQGAQNYADSLSGNYDPAGSASAAEVSAKSYADSLAENYDAAGAANDALAAAEAYAAAAVAALVDSSPEALNTLNELSAALGDDANFASTVTSALGTKTDDADFSAHESATTGVHGIADTSALETQTGAQAKSDAAQAAAEAYADSLSVNYDPAGSAAAAQTAAQAYADQAEADAVSTAAADATSKATAAQAAAESYADSLAVNYDAAGSASTAQSAAESYADAAIANLVDTAPDTLNTLNELAAALGDDPNFATTVATQIGAKADASALSSHESATTSVHGISNTANLVYTNDARLSDDRTPTDASVTAEKIADGAVTSAKIADGTIVDGDVNASAGVALSKLASSAGLSVVGRATNTTGSIAAIVAANDGEVLRRSGTSVGFGTVGTSGIADSAVTSAKIADGTIVDGDISATAAIAQSKVSGLISDLAAKETPAGAQSKADAAKSGAEATAASALLSHESDTTGVHGIADTSLLATKAYADSAAATAAAAVVDTAPATLDTLNELAAALGDDPNFATTVATQIGAKADAADLTDHTSATTNVHGIPDTSELETQTGAQAKADNALNAASAYTDTSINALDTDDIEEGASNKYFTDVRAQDAAAQMIVAGSHINVSVDYDLIAGTLSLTGAETYGSVEFAADFATKDTDDLSEGGNLYFTNQRALDATAAAYDPTGSAAAAQAAAESYTDSAVAAFDALPSQSGNTGKYLTTDGSTAAWQTLPGLATSVEVLFEEPSGTPPLGACYFDALLNTLRIYNGGAWVSMAPESGSVISAGSASNPGSVLYNAGDSDDPSTGTAPVNGGTSAG